MKQIEYQIFNLVCTANYDNYEQKIKVLLLSYYIRHVAEEVNTIRDDKNKIRIRYKKLSKKFMKEYTDGNIDVSEKEFDDILETLRRYVDDRIKVYYSKLRNISYKAWEERIGEYRY